jgi:hypothetical protein
VDLQVQVFECYRDYVPPFDSAQAIRNLLRKVPGKYLTGLDCIVLKNDAALSRKDRRGKIRSRGRKVAMAQVLGLYHHAWQGKKPWIEIRVEKILAAYSGFSFRIPLIRNIFLGNVLYHELGHHIHNYVRPEYREKEDVAEYWRGKLMTNFLRKQYWYALWLLVPLAKLLRWRDKKRASH